MGKTGKTISIIVGVIVVGLIVQFARFVSKTKDLENQMCAVLPVNYFPFNGTFCNTNNKLTKS